MDGWMERPAARPPSSIEPRQKTVIPPYSVKLAICPTKPVRGRSMEGSVGRSDYTRSLGLRWNSAAAAGLKDLGRRQPLLHRS